MYEPRKRNDLPHPLSEFFIKRMKVWLEIELSCPRVATVQALAILSSYEGASGRDTRGWIYSGTVFLSKRPQWDYGLIKLRHRHGYATFL